MAIKIARFFINGGEILLVHQCGRYEVQHFEATKDYLYPSRSYHHNKRGAFNKITKLVNQSLDQPKSYD